MSEEWRDQAACKNMPPNVFFPDRETASRVVAQAKAVCARCPVREECLAYALDEEIRHGVWGGKSEKERRRLRRGRSHTETCKWCGDVFTWIRRSTGNVRPVYCSKTCRNAAKNKRENPHRKGVAFGGKETCHSLCDDNNPRDRSAFSAVYPEGDWGLGG